MNINISDNLRRLRKQRELTQEDLANFIGVSFQAVSDGKQKESIELLREALKIFPNNYQLLADLASALFVSNSDEEKKKNGEEAVKISERILEFCTDTEIRNRVEADMCLNLHNAGKHEKAAEFAEKLPSLNYTREKILTIAEGVYLYAPTILYARIAI